jgi:putative DNA primase/helicase
VTKPIVGNVDQALKGLSLLPFSSEPPLWLSDNPPFPAADVLPARNALVHLPGFVGRHDEAVHNPTPNYFGSYALDYDFDPHAPPSTNWTAFLRSVWPTDEECIDCLQEWMGYLLTPDTSHQKIGVFIGPTRSGRGTISRVIRGLVGACNVASPTFSGLSSHFGAACLVGKPVAIIGDARISNRSDLAVALERLLMISGEDAIEIDRKNKPSWEGKLPTRIMLISNELPRIPDTSGALAARFLLFPFTESFLGREDKTLDKRLEAELPGILLWAIEGWRRLRQRGAFVQPASGREMVSQMHDLSSPVGAYIKERTKLGAGFRVRCSDLFDDWKMWCSGKNREPGEESTFGRNLRTVIPTLGRAYIREKSTRVYYYEGLELKDEPVS